MDILELELLNKRQASSDNIVMSKTDLLQAITILKKKTYLGMEEENNGILVGKILFGKIHYALTTSKQQHTEHRRGIDLFHRQTNIHKVQSELGQKHIFSLNIIIIGVSNDIIVIISV